MSHHCLHPIRVILLAALAVAEAGCADPRQRADETLRRVGSDQVRKDAALLYKRIFAGHGTDFVILRERDWPESFRQFSPIRVGAYPDGISLTLNAKSDVESGLYVVPLSMDHVPTSTDDAKFQRLAEGIYWYSFGD